MKNRLKWFFLLTFLVAALFLTTATTFATTLNVATKKSVTASSNIGSTVWNTTFLTDGILTSAVATAKGWSSNTGTNQNPLQNEWINVNLGTSFNINEVRIYPRTDNGGYSFPIDFTIQVSEDSTNWTTVVTRTGYTIPVIGVQTFTFTPISAKYVKVDTTKMSKENATSSYYRMQLSEIEVYSEIVSIPTTAIAFEKTALSLDLKKSLSLSPIIIPSNATNAPSTFTWQSSNSAVAVVDSIGNVTPMSIGTAVITATAEGGLTATCSINVYENLFDTSSAFTNSVNADGTLNFTLDTSKVKNMDSVDHTLKFIIAIYNVKGKLTGVKFADSGYTYKSCWDATSPGAITSTSQNISLSNIPQDTGMARLFGFNNIDNLTPKYKGEILYNIAKISPQGFPKKTTDLDVLPSFKTPPLGYGDVAFYWWSNKDPLTKERLQWQLDLLKNKGVSGLQVNYFHTAAGGNSYGLTFPSEPKLFTPEWWDIFQWFTNAAKKENISVSLSDYTLCTPGQKYFTDEIIAKNPDIHGANLVNTSKDYTGGTTISWPLPADSLNNVIRVVAYQTSGGVITPGTAVDLYSNLSAGTVTWNAPAGTWKLIAIYYRYVAMSIDPMNPLAGKKIIETFYQPFEDRNPTAMGNGLNYFFSDEFVLGISGNLWNSIYAQEFQKRKGYDIVNGIEAIFFDIGPTGYKIKLDYNDVLVSLSEEGTYKPLYDWHNDRGMLYGCDWNSRGSDPSNYGDYFRIVRWHNGPGNDQSRLGTTVSRTKVNSSIAHLYERPRTWLEGYWGSGWGTTSDAVANATFKNFAYGSNLLTLHGLYYSTYGGYMEWAPPDNHFHMPYWNHMSEFLKANERLSYLLSQGVHSCDVAVMYPVAPGAAGLTDKAVSTNVSLDTVTNLYNKSIDADFIDAQSVDRAVADSSNKTLNVAGEKYKVIVIPSMRAINYSNIQKLLDFYNAGGIVISVGRLPEISDRIGGQDAELDAKIKEIFGYTSAEAAGLTAVNTNTNTNGGKGIIIPLASTATTIGQTEIDQLVGFVNTLIVRDFNCLTANLYPNILHRKIGPRDVYMVYGATKNAECEFRSKGKVELWNHLTGETTPLLNVTETTNGTKVRMPLGPYDVQLVIFSPDDSLEKVNVVSTNLLDIANITKVDGNYQATGYTDATGSKNVVLGVNNQNITLSGNASRGVSTLNLTGNWNFELKPSSNNKYGDYRLPAFDGMIGAEARHVKYMQETTANPGYESPSVNDTSWDNYTYNYGPEFWKLGPVPETLDPTTVEATISKLTTIDPTVPVVLNGVNYYWKLYNCSDRFGVEWQPGVQGYHGLKGNLTDDFILLGKVTVGASSETFANETDASGTALGKRYYLWSTVNSSTAQSVNVNKGGLNPASLWVNGGSVTATSSSLQLNSGNNTLLIRYDSTGRAHYALETSAAPSNWVQTYPLAMSTYNKPGVLNYDVYPNSQAPAGWYRFTSPPGMNAMTVVSKGTVQAWANGEALSVTTVKQNADGSSEYKILCNKTYLTTVKVALRIAQQKGYYGGGTLVEPVKFDCGQGEIALGDWSTNSTGLYSYSGGAYYRKTLTLTKDQICPKMILDLTDVVSTAEVKINGQLVGTRVAKPWTLDISGFLKEGDNQIEVLVYNTLSNHYTTIPSSYRGALKSGLIGSVKISGYDLIQLR